MTGRLETCPQQKWLRELHLIDTSCAKQSIVALSSGGAEYYALTREAAAGLMSIQVYKAIGLNQIILCMLTVSTAAKGIPGQSGSGSVKHLSIREHWLQDKAKSGEPGLAWAQRP